MRAKGLRIDSFPLILGFLCFSLYLVSCYMFSPGFMHDDSRWMLYQAMERNIADWHPPLLIWFWSNFFNPIINGPLVPFLIQNFIFWLGILFLSLSAVNRSRLISICLPLLIFFLPQTFIVYWVSTDGSFLAVCSLALGMFSLSFKSTKRQNIIMLSIAIGSLTYLSRPYLWLIFGFVLLFYFWIYSSSHWKKQKSLLLLSILGIPLMSAIFTSTVVKPAHSYPVSPVILMDLMAMECQGREASDQIPEKGLLPRVFVLNEINDFCKDYTNQTNFLGYFVNPSDKTETKLRWIANSSELQIASRAWLQGFLKNPTGLLQRKIINFKGSNVPGLYGNGLIPNTAWDTSKQSKIGFGHLDGFNVNFNYLTSKYLNFQIQINKSWAGLLLQTSPFLIFLGALHQMFIRRRESLRFFIISLVPFFIGLSFFFITGMNVYGSRYYQTLNLLLAISIILTFISPSKSSNEQNREQEQ